MLKCPDRSETVVNGGGFGGGSMEKRSRREEGVGCIGGSVSLGRVKIAISHPNRDTLRHFLQNNQVECGL